MPATPTDSTRLLEVKSDLRETEWPRLDVFLGRELGLSRAQVRRLLADGQVKLEGRIVRERDKGRLLRTGTQIHVEPFACGVAEEIVPEPERELELLAQGPGWVACCKPAGMPVHPLSGAERGTLAGAVMARFPEMQGVGEGGLRSGVVHRLDLPTSGVVLLATQEGAWRRLRRAFEEHRISKTYLALVWGRLLGEGREVHFLKVAQHHPARVRVVAESEAKVSGVRRTRLAWKAIEHFGDTTLLEISLETGFLHQIRAVFADRGYPVVGDSTYGLPEHDRALEAPRLMLHAARIRFEEIEAACPLPADFCAILDRLRETQKRACNTVECE